MISYPYLRTLGIIYTKALKNRLSLQKSMHYQPFLIAGLPRSGTTLLHTYLNSHPNLHSQGEVDIRDLQQVAKIFIPYGKHIQAAGPKVLLPSSPQENDYQLIRHLLSASPQTKIIFIQRENLLRWYTSLQIAYQTQQWSQSGNGAKLADRQVFIDPAIILDRLQEAEKSIAKYRELFKEVPCMEITYEHLVQLPQQLLPNIQHFLGLKPAPLFSLLQKQNPEPLSSLISNYDEIVDILINTTYVEQLNA